MALDEPGVTWGSGLAGVLGRIGPPAVPALVEALRGREALFRAGAARALGRIGPAARDAAPAPDAALRDDEARARVGAAEALWQVAQDPAAPAALAAMLRAGDPTAGERTAVLQALERIGPAARTASPALRELIHRGTTSTRSTAAAGLRTIDPEAAREAGGLAAGVEAGRRGAVGPGRSRTSERPGGGGMGSAWGRHGVGAATPCNLSGYKV